MRAVTPPQELSGTTALQALFMLIRPAQWSKNSFVLAGFVFARQWSDTGLLSQALAAFVAFCAAASAAYVFNDWHDREADRRHPVKRRRPLASGALSARAALLTGLTLALIACSAGWLAGPRVLLLLAAYVGVNLLYSLHLKHVVIVDVFAVASGFMFRLFAGTWGIGIPPSDWMILTGLFLTLFLGFAKRRAEWTDAATEEQRHDRRRVMSSYSAQLIDTFLAVTATAAILSYGLYTVDAQTAALHGTSALVYTVPFVTFGIFRYLFLVHLGGRGEDPSRDVFTDPQILACGLLWLAATVAILS